MKYKFANITNLIQMLSAIEGNPRFKVGKTQLPNGKVFTYVDYIINDPTSTFPEVVDEKTATLRECRGIIFDNEDRIFSRGFHKFFNYGERRETFELSNIEPKLDGSMIRSHILESGEIVFFSKRGYTELSIKVFEFWKNCSAQVKAEIYDLTSECQRSGLTPIWEYCALDQRIVLEYKTPKLCLLDVRNKVNGVYILDSSNIRSRYPNIDIIKKDNLSFNNWQEFNKYVDELEGVEGFVVKNKDGYRVKIKTRWYCDRHKALDVTKSVPTVLALVLNSGLDDIIDLYEPETKKRLEKFSSEVVTFILSRFKVLEVVWKNHILSLNKIQNLDYNKQRKHLASFQHTMNAIERTVYFQYVDNFFDGKEDVDLFELALEVFSKYTVNNKKFQEIYKMYPNFPIF